MRRPAQNNPEWKYAARAREMAFRAMWVDSGKGIPIPAMPRRWRGHEVYRFSGFASPLRQFAIARFGEAQRADPPNFTDPIVRCQAAGQELWTCARCADLPRISKALSGLDGPLRAYGQAQARAARHRSGFEAEHLRLAAHLVAARRAVSSAVRELGRLSALELALSGGRSHPFASVLALDGEGREAALTEQAYRLFCSRMEERPATSVGRKRHALVEIAYVMGWEADTVAKTWDCMRHRFDYLQKKRGRSKAKR